ncbi:hypothetical protein K435DRAFT_702847, partial [Dendrothele bispora CBS 962.96]
MASTQTHVGDSSQPRVPPEMIDALIDSARDSPSILKACSLVARSWLPRSRMHLFRSMRL